MLHININNVEYYERCSIIVVVNYHPPHCQLFTPSGIIQPRRLHVAEGETCEEHEKRKVALAPSDRQSMEVKRRERNGNRWI